MAKKLRLGAVGTGGIWEWAHNQAWLDHPEVEVVALCDIVEEKAQKFAKQHNAKYVLKDYRDLLKLDLDIVDICTPNVLHSEIAVAAMASGKHVVCEKPDAVSPAEAQRAADAATKTGKHYMVMRNNRFNPWTSFLKKYIDSGKMGEIYTGRCGWIRRRGIPGLGGWFTTKALSGGGPLIDLGVHYVDLAIYLMGNPRPVSVVGATYRKFAAATTSDSVHAQFGEAKKGGTFDVEDLATGFIRFDNGATLQIEFSWASNIEREDAFLELRGSKGGCSTGWYQPVKVFTEIEGTLCDVLPKTDNPKANPHADYLHHFVDVVQGRAKPIFTAIQGVDMIKILSSIYASADSGNEVKL